MPSKTIRPMCWDFFGSTLALRSNEELAGFGFDFEVQLDLDPGKAAARSDFFLNGWIALDVDEQVRGSTVTENSGEVSIMASTHPLFVGA